MYGVCATQLLFVFVGHLHIERARAAAHVRRMCRRKQRLHAALMIACAQDVALAIRARMLLKNTEQQRRPSLTGRMQRRFTLKWPSWQLGANNGAQLALS